MEVSLKIIRVAFAAFYVAGLLLFLLAPTISKRFRPRWGDKDRFPSSRKK